MHRERQQTDLQAQQGSVCVLSSSSASSAQTTFSGQAVSGRQNNSDAAQQALAHMWQLLHSTKAITQAIGHPNCQHQRLVAA